ncbi:hypothetical protein GIB67_015725 [Kingdonia uniflora]|uniref:Uncharacterized protein n=1 Tax=Kingdonia uniflora TaxID=39325 RepID=A0A7J7NUJ1_9MAGN|nr:hypothetical protein GIB67_015725 [Kingdonia uniflora]
MENMCSSKWLIKSNKIQGLLLQVIQAVKDGSVDRERDILEGIHLSDESSSEASLTSNLCEPDNIFSHLNTAAHKPSNKKPRKLGLVRIGEEIKIEEETGSGKTKSLGTKRGMKIELECNKIGGREKKRFHCLHCHEGMDNIIRHNGIKHWNLQFICTVPTCLNAYRDKVLLVVLTGYIGAWCLGVGYSTAKPVEEEKDNKWTRKVVPIVLLSVICGVALSAIDDLAIYSVCSSLLIVNRIESEFSFCGAAQQLVSE